MSRNEKLLARILKKPKDFTYDELKRLLAGLKCIEDSGGRTSGSRVAFIHKPTQIIIRLYRPHPDNKLKAYQIDNVLEFLKSIGVI
ncbi:MAG: type II toxin-antitoxin system HicA family toxin [Clostridia bacterium]|nr:type II toxin-antitoxin system HicA family toxin [Clostridia bacterium]